MNPGGYLISCWSLDGTTEYTIEARPTESFEEQELKDEVSRIVREDVFSEYEGALVGILKLVRRSTIIITKLYETCPKHGHHAEGCPDKEVSR